MKHHFIKQHDESDCGAACLAMICAYFGYKAPLVKFRQLAKCDQSGVSILGIVEAATKIGLEAVGFRADYEELQNALESREVILPIIVHVTNEQGGLHFIVITEIRNGKIYVLDPAVGKKKCIESEFQKIWTGNLIAFGTTENFRAVNEKNFIFWKCLKVVLKDKKKVANIIIMSLFLFVIGVVGTYAYRYIIDYTASYIVSLNTTILEKINRICIGIFVLYCTGTIIQMLRGKLIASFARKVDYDIMKMYYEQTLDLPMSFFSTRKTGEITSRYTDTVIIREALVESVISLVLDTLMLLVGIYILCSISMKLSIIAFGCIIVYGIIVISFRKKIKDINEKTMEANAQMNAYFKETIEGVETIKSLQIEKIAKEKLQKLLLETVTHTFSGMKVNNYRDSIMWMISVTLGLVVLWSGAYEVAQGALSMGTLIAFSSMLAYFISPLSNLIELQPRIQAALVASERLGDILLIQKEDVEEGEKLKKVKKDISISNLNFRYNEDNLILKNVNMHFEWGKRIAIIGRSGSGKTTVAKLLVRMYEEEQDSIQIAGISVNKLKLDTIRNKIAYISQENFLFADTILNNLLLGCPEVTEEEFHVICSNCLLDEFVQRTPLGYNMMLEEGGMNLSGGQRQRLAIARALLRKPDILILDEATSNLDPFAEKQILQVVEKWQSQKTCIIITHRLNTVKNSDLIYVMEKGTVKESGNHDELMSNRGLYYYSMIGNTKESM